MRLTLRTYNTSFSVGITTSKFDINYPEMEAKKYDWQKPIVFEKLSQVKKYLRTWARGKKLTSIERNSLNWDITDLNMDDIIDDDIESYESVIKKMGASYPDDKKETFIQEILLAENTGGNIFNDVIVLKNGRLVVITGEGVFIYKTPASYETGEDLIHYIFE